MSRPKQKRNREDNPAKFTLEMRGIKFPRQSSQDCRGETEEVSKPSSILYTAPKDENEEAEQLAIVRVSVKRGLGVGVSFLFLF